MAFSTCSFHHQVSWHQRWGRVVPHSSSVVLSRPVLMFFQISSVAASATLADALTCKLKSSWKWLLVWESLNFQTKTRHELALGFWWHINPHVAYKKLVLQGYFLARDHFHICDKFAHDPMEKDYLCGCVSRLVWDGMAVTFLENVFPSSRWNARAYTRVL